MPFFLPERLCPHTGELSMGSRLTRDSECRRGGGELEPAPWEGRLHPHGSDITESYHPTTMGQSLPFAH